MELDIIGDVHGYAEELEALLGDLGYSRRGGAYRHSNPNRTALFLGDLIDRGPRQLESVDIPRRMRDAGTAVVLMGNHEHNAIGFAMEKPGRRGKFMRIRGSRNTKQHQAFLDAVGPDSALHRELVDWMTTLPLFAEYDELRAVHACWHPDMISLLRPHLAGDGALGSQALRRSFEKGDEICHAAEVVLKGLEIDLPDGLSFHDKEGTERFKSRIRWWDETARTFATATIMEQGFENLPQTPLPDHAILGSTSGKPVFFGHYWMSGEPNIISPTHACLDYSIAKDGHLCAYTWRGETELTADHLSWVSSPNPSMAAGKM